MDKYASDFLRDEALLKYNYHPRSQFVYVTDATNRYTVFPRKNEVDVICSSDSCELIEPFNSKPLKLPEGRYTLKSDCILTEVSYDSFIQKMHAFEISPVDYFKTLKKRIKEYGVLAYHRSAEQSFVKVYLSVEYYLIHTQEIERHIHEDEIVKSYPDNWYFVKMKRQLDAG
ncbi:MAG: hypothetical protein LAT76_09700 [Schleiferiaceae bacterium]|nr:hypothetical protein [Schleiferiaceae bacterium]